MMVSLDSVQSILDLEQFNPEPAGKPSHSGCGSCGSGEAGARCGNGLEKIYPTTAVRFGFMRYIGEFTHAPEMKFSCGAKVVIQTKRGLEMGEQVSLTCTGCDKSVTRDQMRDWVKTCGQDSYIFNAGRILREATAADLAEFTHIQTGGHETRRLAQQLAQKYKLALKIVECECLFGGERITLFFKAPERVDFRLMVKDLANEYRTRIEMRQVGARDEARLVADYETCGREVCCKTFLKTLRPVTMRMAKLQKSTLDPSQVSGRCGRLKCCLRYEHVGYEELDKLLPRNGVRIRTEHGTGVIINRQVLTQLVQIRTDEGPIVSVVSEDILETNVPLPPPKPEPEERPRDPRASARGEKRRSGPPEQKKRVPLRDQIVEQKPTQTNDKQGSPPSADQGPKEGESQAPRRRRRGRGRRRRGGSGNPPSAQEPPTPPPSDGGN